MFKVKGNSKKQVFSETSESIAKQTEAYLKAGGQVDVVKPGVSGSKYFQTTKPFVISKK